jgi:hypothetical protein
MVKQDKKPVEDPDPFEDGLRTILDAGPDKNPKKKSQVKPYTTAILFEQKKKEKKSRVLEMVIRIVGVLALIGLLYHFAVRIASL